MPEVQDEFERIVEDLKNQAKHLGLYLIGSTIATDSDELRGEDEDMLVKNPDIKAMIETGEAQFALMAQFTIGDLAFDARVQYPTQHEVDMEFRRVMPSEAELRRDDIQERLADATDMSDDDFLNALFDGVDNDESDSSS